MSNMDKETRNNIIGLVIVVIVFLSCLYLFSMWIMVTSKENQKAWQQEEDRAQAFGIEMNMNCKAEYPNANFVSCSNLTIDCEFYVYHDSYSIDSCTTKILRKVKE